MPSETYNAREKFEFATKKRVRFFNTAIDAIFKNWHALQMAVAHQAGGVHSKAKAEWMVDVTENWFYLNSGLENWEVEDYLGEIMKNEFNVQIEDGSLLQIGTYCTEYWTICTNETYSEETIFNFLHHLPKCDLSKVRLQDYEDADMAPVTNLIDSLDSSEKPREPKVREEPEIDEDGFQMVKSKSKKKRSVPEVDEDGFQTVKSKKRAVVVVEPSEEQSKSEDAGEGVEPESTEVPSQIVKDKEKETEEDSLKEKEAEQESITERSKESLDTENNEDPKSDK